MNFLFKTIGFCLLLLMFIQCSQDNYSLVNRTFHNTTARYNAYFLAREKMKEVDFKIWEANIDDFTNVLKIYPTIDTNLRNSISPSLEEIIKKAALPVTRHKNSNWVDDSYILIGKSRLYQSDITLALQTFKFVNTKGADINARHAALILLMRTFIVIKDYDNSNAVFNYLKKEELNKENSSDFYLMRAYHYAMQEDFQKAEQYLTLAVKDIKKKNFKGRIHFIIAQINQLQNNEKEAFFNYNQVLKNNPTYELSFYSKLYRTQVSQLNDVNDRKKVEKYFEKLLKDKKNLEYRDKIYYEMGMFELKQSKIPSSVAYFEKSLLEKSKNPYQKAATYLRLGKIYYENLMNYEMAKLYYDSTVAIWNPQDKDFKSISQRQKVLAEFVTHLRVVQREDSLQKLASMDDATLNKFLDDLVLENERKQKEAEKKAKEAAERAERISFNAANNLGGAAPGMAGMDMNVNGQTWYFDNPGLMASGKTEFIKKWGNRRLEDNWRRSEKELSADAMQPETTDTQDSIAAPEIIEKSIEEIRAEAKDLLVKDIPKSPEMLEESNNRLEGSLYNLGKIYNQRLEEPDNALSSFERYITKFPEEENTPEVLYFLYLLYKGKNNDQKVSETETHIFSKYPNSVFAKLIKNPNYLEESKIANKEAALVYKTAYEEYENENYQNSDSIVKVIKRTYPDNDIFDKLTLLEILIIGKTKSPLLYKSRLENFIVEYNTSDLVPLANEYLKSAVNFITDKTSSGKTLDSNSIRYLEDISGIHYFGTVIKTNIPADIALREITQFNNQRNKDLKLEIFNLNDSSYAVFAKEFKDVNDAKRYLIEIKNFKAINRLGLQHNFVITKHNLEILKRSKYVEDYMKFYFEKYQ